MLVLPVLQLLCNSLALLEISIEPLSLETQPAKRPSWLGFNGSPMIGIHIAHIIGHDRPVGAAEPAFYHPFYTCYDFRFSTGAGPLPSRLCGDA